MSAPHSYLAQARQRGAGLVETMIGIVIGLLVVLVIYNLFAAAENFKRMSIGASDAQITGLLAQFVLGRDAGNGGNGLSVPTITPTGLADCVDWTLRPIPVLITDGGDDAVSESFIATSSGSPHVVWPVDFVADAAAGATFDVMTATGFMSPAPTAGKPYLAIAMTNDGAGGCELTQVTAATAPIAPDGRVTLTHTATALSYKAGISKLLNLGPLGQATRVQYDVSAGQLRSRDLTTGAAANPIAQNIVLMKAQYGVDTDNNDIIDCWTPADDKTCGNFSEAAVRGMNLAQLNRILAVRIGVVVRSDEPDLKDDTLLSTGPKARPPVVLFNCSADTKAACQNRIVVPAGKAAALADPDCAPFIICDHWRYRTYEAVVPLRNAIYNATLP